MVHEPPALAAPTKPIGREQQPAADLLDAKDPAIGALDAFALLSTANEGVSQAILQAAFLGKPLIATEVGGLREVCIDGKTGISVPPFHPEAVAQAVLALKESGELRRQLGKNGRHLVEERFTFQKTLDQMEEVYGAVKKLQS